MYDSGDDGLCDGDSSSKKMIVVQKRFEFEFSKNSGPGVLLKSSKRVQVWSL